MSELVPITVKNSGYVELKRLDDSPDGVLAVMEGNRDIPFDIKRIYYITRLDNCLSIRGKHAHKELQQVIFCINGSFMLSLDDGEQQQEVRMWRDNIGVILGKELWHTMHSFSTGCVLLVAASDYFDEADYIRDYDEFLAYVGASS